MKTPNRERSGVWYWWLGAESNHRHEDLQSTALPTELPSLREGGHYSGKMLFKEPQIEIILDERVLRNNADIWLEMKKQTLRKAGFVRLSEE